MLILFSHFLLFQILYSAYSESYALFWFRCSMDEEQITKLYSHVFHCVIVWIRVRRLRKNTHFILMINWNYHFHLVSTHYQNNIIWYSTWNRFLFNKVHNFKLWWSKCNLRMHTINWVMRGSNIDYFFYHY